MSASWGASSVSREEREPHNMTIPRSAGKLTKKRIPVGWHEDRDFKILSLAGGGVRGLYTSSFLAGLEKKYLDGRPIGEFFDLIAGTSTGGIIALGLGKGLSAVELHEAYRQFGPRVFPQYKKLLPRIMRLKPVYDAGVLKSFLCDLYGDTQLGDSKTRLCIPVSEREYVDVFMYKTDHHPDFQKDWKKPMLDVAMQTSAAPTYFKLQEDGGYKLADGGLYANDPIMVAVVEALTSIGVASGQIKILSIINSTGHTPISRYSIKYGGLPFEFRKLSEAMFSFQSACATGQACLIVGADSVFQVAPEGIKPPPIMLDDWRRAETELPVAADKSLKKCGETINSVFLAAPVNQYKHYCKT